MLATINIQHFIPCADEPVVYKNDIIGADLKRHHTCHNLIDFIGQHKLLFVVFGPILDAYQLAKLLREVVWSLTCSTTNLKQK